MVHGRSLASLARHKLQQRQELGLHFKPVIRMRMISTADCEVQSDTGLEHGAELGLWQRRRTGAGR